MKPKRAGPRPLHSPLIPVMIPWATPVENGKNNNEAFIVNIMYIFVKLEEYMSKEEI